MICAVNELYFSLNGRNHVGNYAGNWAVIFGFGWPSR
jgi:hypothetical protein